mgnify:CR=1 FL=1
METHLADFIRDTTAGREAAAILRKCVHCGFCTATCPTYQLLGDELDGPRGRIYLIKQVLEGTVPTEKTRLHLDRCLTCRSCESTCPSGVHYSRLLDIGRAVVEQRVPRKGMDGVLRATLRELLPRPMLFGTAMKLGQMVRPLLPEALKSKVPPLSSAGITLPGGQARKMLVLAGCAQPSMYPNINGAATRVLARLGIALAAAPHAGCCGAVRLHLADEAGARENARRNIDAWWPRIEADGVAAIVMTASGCGVQVKDYGHLLQDDPAYAAKALRVAELTRDVSEVVAAEQARLIELLAALPPATRVPLAFHAPCTLQHGFQIRGVVESLLGAAGFRLTPVADSHLCCGSAGTYSILQPELSGRLQANKIAALTAGQPAGIASANIGCIAHLQAGTETPVKHWIEWLDERLTA